MSAWPVWLCLLTSFEETAWECSPQFTAYPPQARLD